MLHVITYPGKLGYELYDAGPLAKTELEHGPGGDPERQHENAPQEELVVMDGPAVLVECPRPQGNADQRERGHGHNRAAQPRMAADRIAATLCRRPALGCLSHRSKLSTAVPHLSSAGGDVQVPSRVASRLAVCLAA